MINNTTTVVNAPQNLKNATISLDVASQVSTKLSVKQVKEQGGVFAFSSATIAKMNLNESLRYFEGKIRVAEKIVKTLAPTIREIRKNDNITVIGQGQMITDLINERCANDLTVIQFVKQLSNKKQSKTLLLHKILETELIVNIHEMKNEDGTISEKTKVNVFVNEYEIDHLGNRGESLNSVVLVKGLETINEIKITPEHLIKLAEIDKKLVERLEPVILSFNAIKKINRGRYSDMLETSKKELLHKFNELKADIEVIETYRTV